MLTSHEQHRQVKRCQQLGIGSYVSKPFKTSDLLDAIGAVDGDDVALSVVDSNSSCLIRRPGGVDSKFVVMPMRL